MQLRTLISGFVLGAAVGLIGSQALSQDHGTQAGTKPPGAKPAAQPPSAPPAPEEMQKMMKAWMEVSTPGEEHAQLLKSVGEYDVVTKIWMTGPDAPPTECKGTSEVRSVLGGRFIQQIDHNSYPLPDMKTGEMKMTPMEGMGRFGYDKYQHMYVGCWADSLNTYMLTMRGVMNPDGKTLTMYGEMDEPMLGVRGRTIKYVTKHISDDKYTFTIYDLAVGDDYKAVEIEYTRKK